MAKRFSKIILAMMMAFTTIQSFAYDFAAEKENGKVNALSIGEATITARCGNISNSCEVKAKEYIETDSKIQITCNGETVRNGGCYFSSRFYDWGGGLGMYESGIKVFALKDCELHVSVSNIGDVDLGFCWLNMRLLAKGESTTSSGFCESGSQNDLQIQYTTLDTSADFNAQAKVCVWCDDNVQSAVEFIVTMTNNVIHATGIILECNNIELKCGEKKFIRASVVPENATDKPIYWSSSNEGIATVDQNGEIMAKSVGDAVITASCGSVSSSCSVTVNPIPATEIAINKNSLTLLIGETETLIATVLPVDATYKTVTWGSSDNNVVSVNTDGTVTAVKVGNAIITATCGTLSETCSVTVNSIEVTGIYLDKSELSLLKGNTATIIATIEPSTATDKTMEWKSYNQNVASVDKDGKITAKSVGIANITATASNGISAACRVEVNEDFKFEVVSKTEKTCRIVSNNKHYSGNVDIPENAAINFELYSVVEIGERVFYNNHDITAISLPTTIKVVGNEAFAQCTKLQSVNIANNINKINNTAFSGCTGLISVQTIEQTQATVTLKANINGENHGIDGYFTEHYGNKILFGINDLTTTIKNLEPNNYYIYSYGLKIGDNYCYVGTNSFTTKDIILNPIYENRTASSFVINVEVNGGDIKISDAYFTDYPDKQEPLTFKGLEPGKYYNFNYTMLADDLIIMRDVAFNTQSLSMQTQAAQPMNTTTALLTAKTNTDDDEENVGFEWRRYDAPESMPSTKVVCAAVDGVITGALSGLNPDVYYNYRPYYTSDSGKTYYGDWVTFFTGDAGVFFDPTVKTYEAENINDNSAMLKGYALRGSDDVEKQGFEFWGGTDGEVEVSGQKMKHTLTNLKAGTKYFYRTFVQTAKGRTYGEEQSFETTGIGGIEEVIEKEGANIEGYYNLQGYRLNGPTTGFNIIRYSDGTAKKVLIK